MNYIVFDLEWNQNPDGRRHPDSRLPFEIIEIGAVKLNEKREIVDTFQCLIKPKVYHWIDDSIHEVIHVDYHELEKGRSADFWNGAGRSIAFLPGETRM